MPLDYDDLRARVRALTEGETDEVALMATVACEVHWADDRFDWTGFYRVVAPSLLKVGPYQGGHGCLVIPFERGVCGACARTGEVQIVPDVELFPGHIACDAASASEIVVPIIRDGELIAVLDIDSPSNARFTKEDEAGCVRLGEILANAI